MQDIKGITAQLQEWINQMQSVGKVVDIDAINQHLAEMMTVQNSTPIDKIQRIHVRADASDDLFPFGERMSCTA